MKKNIAVIYGGYSPEHGISVLSGKYIASIIDKKQYNIFEVLITKDYWKIADTEIEINKNDFSFCIESKKIFIDKAVIAIHGTPGENGLMQAYLEMLSIPHSTCKTLVSSLTFNKYFCNNYLRNTGVQIANSVLINKNNNYRTELNNFIKNNNLPIFIKPNEGGSSFGTFKIKKTGELENYLQEAFKYTDELIAEEFVEGRELTCGVVKLNNNIKTFTPCEIVSKHEFFDYEAKYNSNLNEEIIPTDFKPEIISYCRELSKKIYKHLNCQGLVRIDYIVKQDKLFFLEVNTVPGMTAESIVPKMIAYDKIDITELFTQIIEQS